MHGSQEELQEIEEKWPEPDISDAHRLACAHIDATSLKLQNFLYKYQLGWLIYRWSLIVPIEEKKLIKKSLSFTKLNPKAMKLDKYATPVLIIIYLMASIMPRPIITQFEACCGRLTGSPDTQQ